MDKISKIFLIAVYHIRKWALNPRVYLIALMSALYLHSILSPVVRFCMQSGYGVSPFLFPYILSHTTSVMIFFFGIVLLFCDAPFVELDQPYLILRSGRTTWLLGQMLYIVIGSLLYIAFFFVATILILSPCLEWGSAWGKVVGTFAQTTVALDHGIVIPFSKTIYHGYSPLGAMLACFLNSLLVSSFLGFLMFLVNLKFSRVSGVLFACLLILWQAAVTKTWTGFTHFSPLTWVSLSQIDITGSTLYPSQPYVLVCLSVLLAGLLFLCTRVMKHKDIDVLNAI